MCASIGLRVRAGQQKERWSLGNYKIIIQSLKDVEPAHLKINAVHEILNCHCQPMSQTLKKTVHHFLKCLEPDHTICIHDLHV